MVPAGAGAAASTKPIVEWLSVEYDPTSSNASDAKWSRVTGAEPALGKWVSLDLSVGGGHGAMLSAKVAHSALHVLVEKSATEGAGGGCCADTLRSYALDGTFTELDLNALIAGALPKAITWAHATHTFDAFVEDDEAYALLQVQYENPAVGGARTNGLLKVDLASKAAVKTRDGDAFWDIETRIGAETYDYNSTVYKLQYRNGTGTEEFHGNGVLKFTTVAGVKLLALTHRFYEEAFVVKDPWAYSKAEGADAILQRFGTTPYSSGDDDEDVLGGATASFHRFGLPPAARQWSGGVHNVFYTPSTKTTMGGMAGKESITLFVNSIQGRLASFVFEFELKLTPEDPKVPNSDASFGGVAFAWAETGFKAMAMGGARVIGNGVYLVASGASSGGEFQIIDVNNTKQTMVYPGPAGSAASLYDTFARVVVEA